MIEIKALSKSFGSREVLKSVNLNIHAGAVTGIVGPNACGKTTLIKCLLGLVPPSAGEVWIDGVKTDSRGEFRRKIGYMPQTPTFPSRLRLRELLDMLENLRGEKAVSREELTAYFELSEVAEQFLDQLSGGTKQKVAAVVAFMFNAPVIILDEPTVGLDPVASVLFKDLVLKRAAEGATVVFVSHIMAEMETMARELAFLDEGGVVFTGLISELMARTGASHLERAVIHLFKNHKESSR